MDIKTNVTNHIKAGFGVIAINTSEETRALSMLTEIAKEMQISMWQWSITGGILDLTNGNSDSTINDPQDFLKKVVSQQKEGIFCILDPNPFLDDPVFQRRIKDCLPCMRQGKPLFLIGPFVKVPSDMLHLVCQIEMPLPNSEELKKVLIDSCQSAGLPIQDENDSRLAINSLKGLTTDEASDAVALSLVADKKINPKTIMNEKATKINSIDYLRVIEPCLKSELGGLENLKDWLNSRVHSFLSPKAKEFSLPTLKGLILLGPPGTGKSLAAKTVANYFNVLMLQCKIDALMGGLYGETEKNTNQMIKIAEALAPCVLWIDEIDKQFGDSNSSNGSHEVTKRVMGTLLTWFAEKKSDIFIVCTANNIINISKSFPELFRKGRWDEIFFIDYPNSEERKEIFKIHITKNKRDPISFDLEKLSKETEGFSGAEIEGCIRDAMFQAFSSESDLSNEYILQAVKNCVPQSKMQTIQDLRDWAKNNSRPATKQTDKMPKRKVEL